MQTGLDKWLNPNKKTYNIFYLDWEKSNIANWLIEIPKKYNVKKIIKWNNKDILVVGNIETDDNFTNLDSFKHTSLLKSNLQKAIRRGKLSNSLSTAKLMIKTDFSQFIRRLAIIMLEDTTLHVSINTIIWMTAMYPVWKPNKIHIKWLLSIVNHICLIKNRDLYLKETFDINKNLDKINNLKESDRSIIYSLSFRLSYGGMKGDMGMIQYLTNLWLNRFQNNEYYHSYDNIEIIDYNIKNIKINQILLEAVDFHCYPQIINKIKSIYLELEEEDIKKSIWFNRSCYNYRNIIKTSLSDKIENNYSNIWDIIKYDVNKISRQYLNTIH